MSKFDPDASQFNHTLFPAQNSQSTSKSNRIFQERKEEIEP